MTNEQIAALVGAFVMCLGNISGLFVVWRKLAEQRLDREKTKISRDADSQELHDQILKNTWEISQLKDMSGHRDQVIEQLQQQITILNSTMATTNVKLDNLVEVIKELKK